MSISKAFLVFSLISLSMVSYREAKTGYVAPLIHITSPEHPLYNPNKTRADLDRDAIRVSNERLNHFARQSIENYAGSVAPVTYTKNYAGSVAPVTYTMAMKYYIGTPPIVTYTVPDTGSHINWLQCQPCNICYPQEVPIFNPANSSTYRRVPCSNIYCQSNLGMHCADDKKACEYTIKYADESETTGVVSRDTITLPGDRYGSIPKVKIPNIVFGCGFKNTDPTGGLGGVIGLRNVSYSLPGQMGINAFSYCISDGGDGGYIRFGSEAILMGNTVSLFTDLYGQYQTIMVDVIVGGNRLNLSKNIFKMVPYKFGSGVTVDSGSQFTLLHPVAYDTLVFTIRDMMIGHESRGAPPYFNVCYNAVNDNTSVAKLPSVHFLLGDSDLVLKIPNENVWSEEDIDGNICLKIFRSPFDLTVIGAEQLISYNVGFDLHGKKLWLDYQEDCRS